MFQKKYHGAVVPVLIRGMHLSNHPRVVSYAALCIVDFCRFVVLLADWGVIFIAIGFCNCRGINSEVDDEEEEDNAPPSLIVGYADKLLGPLCNLLRTNKTRVQYAIFSTH